MHATQSKRPETGTMRFGTDWPGVFIRGDNAAAIAAELAGLIGEPEPGDDADPNTLTGLLVLLRQAGRVAAPGQQLCAWSGCRARGL